MHDQDTSRRTNDNVAVAGGSRLKLFVEVLGKTRTPQYLLFRACWQPAGAELARPEAEDIWGSKFKAT